MPAKTFSLERGISAVCTPLPCQQQLRCWQLSGAPGGSSQSGSKLQTVPGQLWVLVTAEVPKTQPHGSAQHRARHSTVQPCWVLWTGTGSRNNDPKNSNAQVSSKRLRLKGQDCFHPTKACFHPNLSQITHQMKKKWKSPLRAPALFHNPPPSSKQKPGLGEKLIQRAFQEFKDELSSCLAAPAQSNQSSPSITTSPLRPHGSGLCSRTLLLSEASSRFQHLIVPVETLNKERIKGKIPNRSRKDQLVVGSFSWGPF